jgi:hypothetical protein
MFLLGIFIGTIVTIAVASIKDWSKVEKILTAVFTATFAGVVFTFVKQAAGKNLEQVATFYPIGLFYGLLFYYARAAMVNIGPGKGRPTQIAGWLHILGLIAAVGFGLALFFSSSFRDLLPKDQPPPAQASAPSTNR